MKFTQKEIRIIIGFGYPVDIDWWIANNLAQLCNQLISYRSRQTSSARYNEIHNLMLKIGCMGEHMKKFAEEDPAPTPTRPKTEQDRMRDFFFPKRRGSYLLSLKSWKR